MYKKIFLLCLCSLVNGLAFSQGFKFLPEDEWITTKSGYIAGLSGSYNDTINDTKDDYYKKRLVYHPNPSNLAFKDVNDYIMVGVNHDTSLITSAYKYAVTLQILKFIPQVSSPGYYTDASTTVVLDFEYDPDSLAPYKDINVYRFSSIHAFKVVVLDIQDISGTPTTVPRNQLAKNFFIKTNASPQRYDYTSTTPIYIYPSSSVSGTSLDLTWNTSVSSLGGTCPTGTGNEIQPVEFELEWTYIDDYRFSMTTETGSHAFGTSGTIDYDFTNNSTRIRLRKNNYSIPLIYESGAIVYRVRAIRPEGASGGYNGIIYGDWNLADAGSVSSTESCKVYVIPTPHENDQLNWQYTINFAEEGKYKHVINYFDGSLKNRQTQTKINTDNNYIIAVDKVYDYEGNKALETLPTPVIQTDLGYNSNIARNSTTNDPYVPSDFDILSCNLPTSFPQLSNSSAAKIYYSSLNADTAGIQKFVPDAKGYPLTQAIYSPDKLLLWQSGAGADHQLWTGHSTRYEYSRANQDELNGLFGSEAGIEDFYPKVVTTDPNKQSSFTITNTQGQTVATGLIGLPDTTSVPIDRIVTADTGGLFCFNVLGSGVQDRLVNGLGINKKFYVEKSAPHSIQYRVKVPGYPVCSNQYIWASASYNFSVIDECGVPAIPLSTGELGYDSVSLESSQYYSGTPDTEWVTKGNYTIDKKLSFNRYEISNRVETFVKDNEPTCFKDEKWYVKNTVVNTSFPCIDSGSIGPCGLKKRRMMDELWPDAKYGQYLKNDDGSFYYGSFHCPSQGWDSTYPPITVSFSTDLDTGNSNSIFTNFAANADLIWCLDFGVPSKKVRYKDPCIQLPDTVIKNGIIYTNLASLPIDTFIYIFNDEIAETLLPLHPEYCKLKLCDDGEYLEKFQSFQTYKQAELGNMFMLDSIIKYDPIYYKADPGDQATIQQQLSHLKNLSGTRIDTLALEQAYCTAGNAQEVTQCVKYLYATEIQSFTFIDSSTKQHYYEEMQHLYLVNRASLLQHMMDSISNTCATCANIRMTLVDPPIFYNVFNTNGGFDTSLHMPSWIDSLFININDPNYDLSTLQTPTQLQDSLNKITSTLDTARVDAIMAKLHNCSTLQTKLDDIRNELLDAVTTGSSIESPVTIQGAIVTAGVPLTDLCNGYLPNLKAFNTTNDIEYSYDCESPSFYNAIIDFFSRPEVIDAIKNTTLTGGATYGFNFDAGNVFETRLADQTLSGYSDSATVQGFLDTIQTSGSTHIEYIKLKIEGYTSAKLTYLYLYNKTAGEPQIHGDTSLTINIEDAYCINDDKANSLSEGKLGQNTAIVKFYRDNGVDPGTENLFYLWSKDIAMMGSADGKLAINCITCIDVKNALKNFNANYDTGNINRLNHAFVEKHLANYLNYTLNKKYTYHDYYNLIKACALSDSLDFKRYFSSIEVVCSTKALADGFVSDIASFTSRSLIDFRLEYGSGNTIIGVDFGVVDEDSLLHYKYQVTDIAANASCSSTYLPEEPLKVFIKTGCSPSPSISSFGSFNTDGVKLYRNNNQLNGTLYTYSGTYSSPYDHAQLLANIFTAAEQCGESFVIPDAELFRGDDYGSTYSDDYLSYVYSLDTLARYEIRDSISKDNLQQVISSFSGKQVAYDDPYCTKSVRDLYIYDNSQGAHPGSVLLMAILDSVKARLGNTKLFLSTGNLSAGTSTVAIFRKASGVHWYRYFDTGNNLYNVHLQPPSNPAFDINTLKVDSVSIGPGIDSIYRFTAYMHYDAVPSEVIECKGYTDFPLGYGQRLANVVLYDKPGLDFCLDSSDCEYAVLQDAIQMGKIRYKQAFDSTVSAMSNDMFNYLLDNSKDTLYFCAANQKNQITLHYYDLNGNLRKTVPPAGVSTNPATHSKLSVYEYDSRNLLVKQTTPDGGEKRFYYDGAGRPVFSQNGKQRSHGTYSYTLYDKAGRPMETGEVLLSSPGSTTPPTYVSESYNDLLYDMDTLTTIVRGQSRSYVVQTIYDTAMVDLGAISGEHLSTQENLINRVSAIAYYYSKAPESYYSSAPATPTFVTHYSYDMVGNVKTVSYDFPTMKPAKQEYKRVDYEYDQISGKVNMLSYNRSRPDQFYQRYTYDADNRITKAETSNDGIIWNRDASYQYYKHGPLGNVKVGNQQIQSIDYAYTIQGWLKAINGDVLRPDKSMNPDAVIDTVYARDVIAHALNYYDGDYSSIANNATVMNFAAPDKDLYNGNIVRTNTAILGLGNQRGTYRYDQTHKLTSATYETINESNLAVNTASSIYKNTYKYDYDGNIQELVRYDGGAANIDSMIYHYAANTNRLSYVDDKNASTGGEDFQPGQTSVNYTYDSIGNMETDTAGAIKMEWTSFGKLRSVERYLTNPREKIYYNYDGLGNRIRKTTVKNVPSVGDDNSGEYYVRDASGNILATYRFHSIYSKISLIAVSNSGVHNTSGFTSFVNGRVASLSTYLKAFADDAITTMPGWVDAQTDKGISFYLSNDAGLFGEILTGTDAPDYLNDLQDYSAMNDVLEILAKPMDEHATYAEAIMNEVMSYETETKAMFSHFDEYMDATALDNMWSNLGVGETRDNMDHTANATTLYNFMVLDVTTNQPAIMDEMMYIVADDNANNDGNNARAFYGNMMHDDVIFESTNLRGGDAPTDFEGQVQDMLYMYGDRDNLSNFFDSWGASGDWLTANTTLSHRMQVVYTTDADAVLEDYLNNIGNVTYFDTLLAGVDEINAHDYLDVRVSSAVTATLGAVDMNSLYAYGAIVDTTDLSEHHIYGSNRLGVQWYPQGTYRQTYNVNAAISPITGLSTPTVWYDDRYADLIKKDHKEPYGQHYTDTMRVGRTLGYRNYEMTDHLGNVLATVLDRKTGVDTGNGAVNYAYYNPDISTSQDYYPFGMRMDGRHNEINDTLYRYGYSGQEKDNSVKGPFKHYDFKYRAYDPRIARFFSIDPITKDYPELTPYQFASNSPIGMLELEGLEGVPVASSPMYYVVEGFRQYFDDGVNSLKSTFKIEQFKENDIAPINTDIREYQRTSRTVEASYNGWDVFKPSAYSQNSDGTYSEAPAPKIKLTYDKKITSNVSTSASTPLSSARSTTSNNNGSSSTTRSLEVGARSNSGVPVRVSVSGTSNSNGTSSSNVRARAGYDILNIFMETGRAENNANYTKVGVQSTIQTPNMAGTTYGIETTIEIQSGN